MKKSIPKFIFLLGFILLISLNSKSQTLSFEERLDCKRNIEKIYWEHRIWPSENKTPKPSFENVFPDSVLSQKVEDDIRKENALEILWQKPITGKQIQAEVERIIKNTKDPEKLKKIFEALGNDPNKIAKGFALPILTDRLIRNYYSKDERIHISLKEKALSEIKSISSIEQMKNISGIYNEVIFVKDESLIDKKGKTKYEAEEIFCDEAEWERLQNLPAGKISSLMEDEFQFYSEAVLEKGKDKIKVGYIVFKKKPFEEWWEENKQSFPLKIKEIAFQYNINNINLDNSGCTNDDMWIPFFPAPERRAFHTAVWTGTEMIVWGGANNTANNPVYFFNSGGKYNPLTDTWTPISRINAPSPRRHHTAVWTGTEMIVWGGDVGRGNKTNTGGRYNPTTDTWISTSIDGAPSPRQKHNAVWTGDRMIIWGGMDSSGGKYDPITDTWETISTIGAPSPREGNIAVWNETEMVIWGGYNGSNYLNDGYMYHPQNDTWYPLPSVSGPTARAYHTAVFANNKNKMIIWGGYNGANYLRDGYIYDFGTNTWKGITIFNAPYARARHTAVWTGSEMIIWGGDDTYNYFNEGGKYNLDTGFWSPISTNSAPYARNYHTAIWTGNEMIVWGGYAGQIGQYVNDGGKYSPLTDIWAPTSYNGFPEPRTGHTAVYTGTEMIIWGGSNYTNLNSGWKYNPISDNWTPTSLLNAPFQRRFHSAIWTGEEMIIWGGITAEAYSKTGGRYSPQTDTWTETSTLNTPETRYNHFAFWTGSEMLIWGGTDYNNNSRIDGGLYNVSNDTWRGMSLSNAPINTYYKSAVWNGSEIIVWDSNIPENGKKYSPSSDLWSDISNINAPEKRNTSKAVWDGKEMLILGNWFPNGLKYTDNVSKYDPVLDRWRHTHLNNFFEPSGFEAVIWSGKEMFAWDGYTQGGRFNPDIDFWRHLSTENAPNRRNYHTAVWADGKMIVWGGLWRGKYNDGGIYCASCPLVPPSSVSAYPSGSNQITVNWSSVPGASSYNVYRITELCNKTLTELVGENITGTTFVDNAAQGGTFYDYSVTSVGQCQSYPSSKTRTLTFGVCSAKPCFSGAKKVINSQQNTCSLTIEWDSATSSCSSYPDIKYTIYKSTDPSFIPSPENQIATCITGNSYTDYDVASGITFYYIVRAEDSRIGGGGPCNNGNFEENLLRVSGTPTGPFETVLFSDDFESGSGNWYLEGGWHITDSKQNSGLYSINSSEQFAFGPCDSQGCARAELINPVNLPADRTSELVFYSRYNTEWQYDFGLVQGSTDGVNWEILPTYQHIDYSDYSYPWYLYCFGEEPLPSFTGFNDYDWVEYKADLSKYKGKRIVLRFGFEPDQCIYFPGWWIDDVSIVSYSSCQNSSPSCKTPPSFNGLKTIYSPSNQGCKIELSWDEGISTCPSGPVVRYNIYRSTDPNFMPSSSNLIASCINSTNYTDTDVNFGTNYYYIVRAEDSTSNGSGPCNSGNTDINLIRKSSTPSGVSSVAFYDNFEIDLSFWDVEGLWQISNTRAKSGTSSVYSGAENSKCDFLTMKDFVYLPPQSSPLLSFWTYFDIEDGWDGGIVDISTDGSNWHILNLSSGYPSQTNSSTYSCIGRNINCFSGSQNFFKQYTADLSPYQGNNIKLRFRYGTDGEYTKEGWYIDDVLVEIRHCSQGIGEGTGSVPDGFRHNGKPLTIKKSGSSLILNWSPPIGSCQVQDYGIYRGNLPFTGYHYEPVICSTKGETTATIPQGSGNYFFVIVPQREGIEGSYGRDSLNIERPSSNAACFPQVIGNCN